MKLNTKKLVLVSMILCPHLLIAGERGRYDKPKVVIAIDSTGNGIVGDSTTDNTKAIQAAIDSCYNAGGGTVEFMNGKFITGPITLKSSVIFQVDSSAVIYGTTYVKAYYPVGYDTTQSMPGSLQPLIACAKNSANITITGNGVIDGQGLPWWNAYNANNNYPRPRLIQLSHAQNILIENVTLQNSPQFHVSLQYCLNVVVRNVTILAPSNSPNTDGIDPATCHFVQILNCKIDNGDDNVAVKSGNNDPADPNAGTSNIFVSGCTFLHGHGCSIGSETNGGVDTMVVTNCTFNGTDNGLRIKSYRGAGGNVRNVTYKNITMTNVKYPIYFSEYYPSIPAQTDPAQAVNSLTPYFHNIVVDSLTATGGSTSNPGCVIVGVPETPMKDIFLENVNISGKYGLEVRNATVYTSNATISATTPPSVIYQVNGSINPVLLSNGTGGGNWNSPSTWLGNVVPDSADYAAVVNGDSIVVDQALQCGSLAISYGGILNELAQFSVKDTFALHDNGNYYNNCAGYPSFPPASLYDIGGASNYVQTMNADSILGSSGYDSTFGNVTIMHDGTTAGANLTVNGTLNINGKFILGQKNLLAGSISGGSPTHYILTNGSGVLKIPGIVLTQKIFPVGTDSVYAPVWIKNAGTADTFSVSVDTGSGSTMSGRGRVNLRWKLSENSPGKGNCTIQLGWMASAEDTTFSAIRAAEARIFYLSDSTDTMEAGTGSYTTQLSTQPFWVSRSGIKTLGSFGVGDFTLTSVEPRDGGTPYEFELYQNYPNPFNPSTVIRYQLSAGGRATLKVYDLLGREVATLVNERQNAGTHFVTFDGSRLASGVYFYRLNAGNFVKTRKLLLVK
ncbi:MAG TPA: glycosyl hydrolase family 28 protein [Candidatus Acidoferrales bacterium]|nr:glycosyl hydrolase family 28 protein [Candidatus Acidoferrales bacterium]